MNQSQAFTATVQNDAANKGVTWTLSGAGCSGSTCGMLSATSSASGTPITYTAPASAPNPATVTLTATSAADTIKSDSATITVSASPPPPPPPGTGTPTYADNGVSCSNSGGKLRSSYTCPLPNVTGAGNAVVVFVQWGDTAVTVNVTDDKGNTYTKAACVAGNQEVCAYVALNVAAGARVITIEPNVSTDFISAAAYEFYNVATSAALDGTCTASGTGTLVSCDTPASITTTAANDLILFWAAQDSAGFTNTTWTAGAAPWTLRTADEWGNTAMEHQVQTAAGAITPSMTMSTTTGHFDGVGLALKSAAAGTTPPTGIRVAYLQHNALPPNSNASGPVHLQFPSKGNLLVASWIGVAGYDITSISSNLANTWTSTGPAFGNATSGDNQIFFAASAVSATNLTLSVTIQNNDISGSTLQLMDVTGAAASPWDQAVCSGTGRCTAFGTQTTQGDVSAVTITSSNSNELIVTSLGVDSNTIIGVVPGNFLSAVPQPISSPDPADQNNGWAIEYSTTTSPRTYVWQTQGGAVNVWASIAVAFMP